MKKFRFTIGTKILGGFLVLIAIFSVNALLSVVTLNNSDTIISRNRDVIDPTVSALAEFKHLVTRSKMLSTNWVYMYRNVEDQQKLDSLHRIEYPNVQARLNELSETWEDKKQQAQMDSIFMHFEEVLRMQREDIMNTLTTFEDYEDPMVKYLAEESLSSQILPQLNELEKELASLSQAKIEEKDSLNAEQVASFKKLNRTTIILGLIVIGLGLFIAFFITRSITRPVAYIKQIILQLSQGSLPEEKNYRFSKDEIGEMAEAVDKLVVGLRSTSAFADNIGKGNYSADYQPLSDEDVLGNALIEMRDNLRKVGEEDKRRNWATEGLATFGEILRKNNDNIKDLSEIIISNMVKYVNANQGGLYIVNDEQENDPYLEMAACYAWDKKKYIEQQVYPGEGMAGQAWLEKDSIYLTDVPEDYITITSGLGEANPSSVLIVPLKVNEEVYGILELASFNRFADHEVEFVEKIAESIASTLSSVRVNERTQKLLEESQQLTEQMRAQEEEMRQNMEELQATQEEIERGQQDRQAKEAILNDTHLTFELNDNFGIRLVNYLSVQSLGYREDELLNMNLADICGEASQFNQMKQAVEAGHTWSGAIQLNTKKGEPVLVKISAGQVRDLSTGTNKVLVMGAQVNKTALNT